MSPRTVYFDEAGFTGNNLSDPQQPWFVYAALAMEPAAAEQLVKDFRARKGIKKAELKFKMKEPKERAQAIELLSLMPADLRVTFMHKRMSLAYKFFEYVFESVLQDHNEFFYNLGFHQFLGQLLFRAAQNGDHLSTQMLAEFEGMFLSQSQLTTDVLFGVVQVPGADPASVLLRRFAALHKQTVLEELQSAPKYLLDLTTSSLNTLLGVLAPKLGPMLVVCDSSKPLAESAPLFATQVGNTNVEHFTLNGKTTQLTYNLAAPPALGNSADTPGLQLADVAARCVAWMARNLREPEGKAILRLIKDRTTQDLIWPTADMLQPGTERYRVNSAVLNELLRRSEAGEDLFDGLPEVVDRLVSAIRLNP